MAFFDSLSKKVTQVGQTTIQKTKEFAEVTRVNSLIDDENKRMEAAYITIGKMYCERHENDAEEGFAEEIMKIKEAGAKIADYQKQIADIKGIVHCEKCGAEIPVGSAFCSACGAPAPVVEAAPAVEENYVVTDAPVELSSEPVENESVADATIND